MNLRDEFGLGSDRDDEVALFKQQVIDLEALLDSDEVGNECHKKVSAALAPVVEFIEEYDLFGANGLVDDLAPSEDEHEGHESYYQKLSHLVSEANPHADLAIHEKILADRKEAKASAMAADRQNSGDDYVVKSSPKLVDISASEDDFAPALTV